MRVMVWLIVLAVFCGAMWGAFLGWDHEYYEVDGVAQGPYRPWQVIACGAAIVLASTVVFLVLRRLWLLVVIPVVAVIGFAVPWAWWASQDTTGLWLAGLFFLLVGGTTGLTGWLALVFGADQAVRAVRRRGRASDGARASNPWG
ncbi:hypothetical protein [Tsukamurella pseudospumae]|uniref:Uncharacterized protein n=1 Tax=Tsukamurella pseudospumae TaxID=239498 RepID=A0A137ZTL9_9ACTN|nr:hypothetical protein [Tsukamurella pseudospumae]KXP01536.1 hypothetical protein AXK61_01665 [Tsukamurella pseudospumae]